MEALKPRPIHYPDSDGERMADNTRQFNWIVTIKENLDALLPDFVAGDLLWYPIEGDPKTRVAPDVLVALGRPKGHRGSYKQWEEDNFTPHVVFEVLSPSNTLPEMIKKHRFYEARGVQEFYIYDPDRERFSAFNRDEQGLTEVEEVNGHISPLLGIRFDTSGEELVIYRPDGARFLTFPEIQQRLQTVEAERQRAETAQQEAEVAQRDAESAQKEAESAQKKAEKAQRRAERAVARQQRRAEQLASQLLALGIEPDAEE